MTKMDNSYVGVSEIAKMFDISKQLVSHWRTRKQNFPNPLAKLATGPIWKRSDIEEWARANNITLHADASSPIDMSHDFIIPLAENMRIKVADYAVELSGIPFAIFNSILTAAAEGLFHKKIKFNKSSHSYNLELAEDNLVKKTAVKLLQAGLVDAAGYSNPKFDIQTTIRNILKEYDASLATLEEDVTRLENEAQNDLSEAFAELAAITAKIQQLRNA